MNNMIKTEEEIHKMASEHWRYVKAVIINSEPNINHNMFEIIGFHYMSAMAHGYKHGIQDSEQK